MHVRRTIQWVLFTLICAASAVAADDDKTPLVVDESGVAHSVAPEDVAKLPRHEIKAKDHDRDAEFEGILLVDLLKSVGVEFGNQLKGQRASNVIVIEATDGYRVSLALAEIDPDTTDKVVLLADRRDGQRLGEKESPYRLVIPSEKRPLRWIRMIRTIRVVSLTDLSPVPRDTQAR